MQLDSLRVIHILKTGSKSGAGPENSPVPGAFFLDSCQRLLWVCTDGQLSTADLSGDYYEKVEILSGLGAYAFLIRVAAGLESQVLGETDIFGQMKEALKAAQKTGELDSDVEFWIQKCFEDTKEIRSQHLENLGGSSYGALVRKFFSEKNAPKGPILLVGAGQLAASIGPYLTESELWILNRSAENAALLVTELVAKGARLDRLKIVTNEHEAFARAAQVVICVPLSTGARVEAQIDSQIDSWKSGFASGDQGRILLHMGVAREAGAEWQSAPNTYFLDDIFALQKLQNQVRSHQVAQAIRACEERAKLRRLGASVSIHHGWEDLALFA